MIRALFRGIYRTFLWICTALGFGLMGAGVCFFFFILPRQFPSPNPLVSPSLLTLTLKGSYEDHPRGGLGLDSFGLEKRASLYDLTKAITQAAQDKQIRGLVIHIDQPSFGMAQIQEIRDALLAFRKAGKPTWCYADSFGELTSGTNLYYLATACDHITVQPLGMLGLTGLMRELPFLKGGLDKLGVTPDLIQKKEYKSYEETFTREALSGPAREAEQAVVDSFLAQVIEGISQGRKLPHESVRSLINNGPYLLEAAQRHKLIDHIGFYDELLTQISKKLGQSLPSVKLEAYLKTLPLPLSEERIALIFASGTIQREKATSVFGGSLIEPREICKAFEDAMKDPTVKAVVFRIDSPGGSPSASEAIRHGIEQAKLRYKKPVIISMGNAAASGGYWIATPGSLIVAQPGTLTGSIGAMGGKFVFSGLFEKLGIQWDRVSTSENAAIWGFTNAYTPFQQAYIDAWIQQIYDGFISRVAKSRKMTLPQVEKVARGRVWTGEQALALNLVDRLGGLQTALDLGKIEVGLSPEAEVIVFPKQGTFLDTLRQLLDEEEDSSGLIASPNFVKEIRSFSKYVQILFPQPASVVYAPLSAGQ